VDCECHGSGLLKTGGELCGGCKGRGFRDSEGLGEAWQYTEEKPTTSESVCRGQQARLERLLSGTGAAAVEGGEEEPDSEEDFD